MENLMEKLNQFTRRELSEDEVYIFPVTLCDNDIDRDNERFSRKALDTLAEKFIGVTGIFDHDPKGENQTARVFASEVVEEDRLTAAGEPYAYLKGYAYMVRTDKNADLIREIDGGIKKEVSVSCAADKHICSICGADRRTKTCRHVKGRRYDGKRCFVTLDDISDAYEWSFVAVPAQVRAGVTKGFEEEAQEEPEVSEEKVREELIERIFRSLAAKDSAGCAKEVFERVKDKLETAELDELCRILAVGKAVRQSPGSCEEYMMDRSGEDIYGT